VPRRLLILTVVMLLAARPTSAREDDPKYRNRPLSEWLEMLRDNQSADRRRAALLAVELIGPAKSPRVVPAIITTLRDDSDERLREAAATALGRIADKIAARPLAEKVPFVAGRDALLAAFRTDKSPRVRTAAATALAKIEKTEAVAAVPDLAAAVNSSETPATVRTAAVETLSRLGSEAEEAVPAFRRALEDHSADLTTRIGAARALGNVGDAGLAALPSLSAVLKETQTADELTKVVAETLGRIGPDAAAAAPRLGEILTAKSSPPELRRAAAGAIDGFGAAGRPALPALRKALLDDDRFVRSLALHAIAQQGTAFGDEAGPTIKAVLACLGDRVVEVRVAAAETVAGIGAEPLGANLAIARERLREATRDSQRAVRDAAEQALKKLSSAP